jgi:hypothetical protein
MELPSCDILVGSKLELRCQCVLRGRGLDLPTRCGLTFALFLFGVFCLFVFVFGGIGV